MSISVATDASWCDTVRLPTGYSWGEWLGEYRAVLRGTERICIVGGLLAKTGADMDVETIRAIAKGEGELRTLEVLCQINAERAA